ncbi:LacI family transcriptional regulator [Ktedonobacter sp. SOSP1-52]|uniref:LacI family DNA-binding transcriptional regulator n=1 Tax=Ktedonobacter sp. SOSP1-52 TaxID=2778366 RepID=UPI0019168E56|nr:LacI family DNA-binding transcriptional regulator [Ktedonobacter sp. SOSP1-52]GHO63837.1 LacI family transcriptional regulator [Ktedonobacter sp. SOSP1-52]
MAPTLPTLRDVAHQAGVSIATVSYVLNGRASSTKTISEATRQRVIQAVAELGYAPNQTARHLRRQKTERICIVLPRLGVPYYEILCQHVEAVAEQHKYSVIISLASSREQEAEVLEQLQRRLADGVLVVHGSWKAEELERLAASGVAVTAMHNALQGRGFDVVRTTEEEAFYQAFCYLLQKGYRQVVCFTAQNDANDTRFEAYQRALHTFHLPLDERLVIPTPANRKETYAILERLLRQEQPPDAIFAGSDMVAIATLWAARDVGVSVPEDIVVIGSGNIPEGEIASPPLTTVGPTSLDFRDVAELLLERLHNPEQPERTLLREWELIIRRTA